MNISSSKKNLTWAFIESWVTCQYVEFHTCQSLPWEFVESHSCLNHNLPWEYVEYNSNEFNY